VIRWLLLVIALLAAWHWWPAPELKRAPGVLAPAAPVQHGLQNPAARTAGAGGARRAARTPGTARASWAGWSASNCA